MGLVETIPQSSQGFTGQAAGDHVVHAQIAVTGRGDGHVLKWIEPRLGFKQTFESQTSFFQEANIRFAVSHQFFLEIKHLILVSLLLVPRFKFLTCSGGHGFGQVVVSGRNGPHVRLVFWDVEFVGKVALSEFNEPKGFGKRGQGHLEETEGIDETDDLVAFDLQEFAPVADLFHLLVVGVVLVHHEIPIVPLEIMSDNVDGTRVVQCEGIQPFEKLLDTLVSSETNGPIVVFGFGHNEIGCMLFLGLHGLDVEEHV